MGIYYKEYLDRTRGSNVIVNVGFDDNDITIPLVSLNGIGKTDWGNDSTRFVASMFDVGDLGNSIIDSITLGDKKIKNFERLIIIDCFKNCILKLLRGIYYSSVDTPIIEKVYTNKFDFQVINFDLIVDSFLKFNGVSVEYNSYGYSVFNGVELHMDYTVIDGSLCVSNTLYTNGKSEVLDELSFPRVKYRSYDDIKLDLLDNFDKMFNELESKYREVIGRNIFIDNSIEIDFVRYYEGIKYIEKNTTSDKFKDYEYGFYDKNIHKMYMVPKHIE